jgi:hypothetical protein
VCKNAVHGKNADFTEPERYYEEIPQQFRLHKIVKNIFCKDLFLPPSSLLKIAEENMQKRQLRNPF